MTDLQKLQHVEENMARRIQFHLDGWEEQAREAREAVAENKNSDWALMEDLAKAYGNAPMVFSLTRHKEYVEAGRGTWLETMIRLQDDLLRQLLMARISNSTSGASNLISEYKLQAIQQTYELVAGWVTVLKAAQPVQA
jgi:hypothetical protein